MLQTAYGGQGFGAGAVITNYLHNRDNFIARITLALSECEQTVTRRPAGYIKYVYDRLVSPIGIAARIGAKPLRALNYPCAPFRGGNTDEV